MTSTITSDGSPTPRKGGRFGAEDLRVDTSPEVLGMAVGSRHPFPHFSAYNWPLTPHMQGVKRPSEPLGISTRGNQLVPQLPVQGRTATDSYKLKVECGPQVPPATNASVVDSLLQRLSEQSPTELRKLGVTNEYDNSSNGSHGSVPITPATEEFSPTPNTEPDSAVVVNAAMLQKLQTELAEARSEVVRMNEELHTTHQIKSTFDHAISQTETADYYKGDVTEQTISQLQNKLNASTRPAYGRHDSWQDDTLSEKSDTKPFDQGIWGNGARQPYAPPMNGWGANTNAHGFGPIQPRPASGHAGYRRNGYLNEPTHFPLDSSFRGGMSSNPPSRPGSAFDGPRYNQYGGYSNAVVPGGNMSPTMPPMGMPPMGMYGPSGAMTPYQPRPIGTMGTRLSPEAAEFNVAPNPWNSQVSHDSSLEKAVANLAIRQPPSESGQYVSSDEPMNYRRLLERNMNCNWTYIVDKIICNNDQQASIFLQQKLKLGTAEQKYQIVEAIIAQAYPLMVNRFGNFLVQRCFEHGTPEQVVAIAGAIRGNTLTLSMDAFGCHVIQKAFDAVPEEYKATMVHELLRRIPETVIHRYACHVWQKLFELRWSDSPPQIMRYVNEALRGMWHEVALGETGSLVVQNIFENCLEEDKRPCINEVLASIDVISHGQFGNWCIQHICEHGSPADRSRAIDHILRFATEYSMDQYASKVIEKCLKIGGNDFLERYLERVCEGRPDRPRMPLIDIAGDQFGNYLIQYILTNSSGHHRDLVATHVRKHMVSLRGSKYGSRVAMLCCNPALATRPGPPTGMQINRYSTHNVHRGGGYSAFR
ncbi:ARM repeat-containing protein [Lophiostoma macrostomum CBS 122681]|uniref:ARM repeat-containing protein n=1 Tax=Lophiostoma macrostomum CBS 122681 TaxID=1314788 RepID=A0A6A6TLQ1_9PLEO|nr:ARM repeat-containing protein [Lophiostoma macrostomum CBS 122681]